MRVCKWYAQHINTNPNLISQECLQYGGQYADEDIDKHFWRSGRQWYYNNCRYCENKKRKESRPVYDPQLTDGWPRDENGRLLNYWRMIDDTSIVLKE